VPPWGWFRPGADSSTSGSLAPGDALAFLDAGADLVQLHSGLVFSGPSLPNRINEAVRWRTETRRSPPPPLRTAPAPTVPPLWLGFLLMGILLIVGGAVALWAGATLVVLPYDLAFLGTARATLAEANPHLLPLIAHDRAGFGGALVADGLAVLALALWGFRRGARWPWTALLVAGVPGVNAYGEPITGPHGGSGQKP